ncbi:mevalonate kinase [Cenarchaeum symbiosum A]|uniref:mevalonate kinase n=1 Tax=Cenarchaeum symbiosum (strain A) TaxID=414004 RepID=A0RY16_CENSY|nr:mevalonate kinase [Cenarchaeum symbiosum A]
MGSAPAKVVLLGEHFVVHGTGALLCAINKRVRVTADIRGDTIRIRSALGDAVLGPGEALPAGHPLGPLAHLAARAISRFGHKGGLEIAVESEIPPGVGLGSSSACCVAAAGALRGLFADPDRADSMAAALEAERTAFGAASGADSAACTYGGIIEYDSISGHHTVEGPLLRLAVADSGRAHSTAEVVRKVDGFRRDNGAEFADLCKKVSGLIPRARAAIEGGDLEGLGSCMSENQECLDRIGVSDGVLRSMVRAGDGPSYGAKVTGAGDGGCVIALADEECIGRVVESLGAASEGSFAASVDPSGLDTF